MRGASVALVPLCGICVNRDGTVSEVVDGKRMYLCASCSDQRVPDPAEQERNDAARRRNRILIALKWNPGSTFGELRDVLNIASSTEDKPKFDRYHRTITRLVGEGVVQRAGDASEYRYWLAGARR
jgi:hypothetical protein